MAPPDLLDDQLVVRMSSSMRLKLKARADDNGRTEAQEVRYVLRSYLADDAA